VAPRIAIPVPHSGDREYADRSLPPYEDAVRMAGGEPVRISLDQLSGAITRTLATCDAVLLPGSKADVDPATYGAARHPRTANADAKRDAIDKVLVEHAYDNRKPLLGICYGLQSLNVHRSGTLVQHIESPIDHEAGRAVALAHEVEIEPGSRLAEIVGVTKPVHVPVNSSHHQSADAIGEGLRAVAYSPTDGIVEAIEGTSSDHFVLAVQWHPERSVDEPDALGDSARKIFLHFIDRARGPAGVAAPKSF
jgi:putative glutamine amidotransferase